MCNLYSSRTNQRALVSMTGYEVDLIGNMQIYPAIYPDQLAPIVRNNAGRRELALSRWGMPSPAFALKGKKVDRGITNVRNTDSSHWRRWLGVESRCLVPFTAFSENEHTADGKIIPRWFALGPDDPLAFFAGVWTPWRSVRKLKDGETEDQLYGFLTTDANAEVGAIHPKAMPVILRSTEEIEIWMTAPAAEALQLQRPLEDGALVMIEQPGQSGS